ncbi:hypothetical protein QTV49_000381 [Vibrio vulnificus]|nr:hypothetical protein [Vibrio vulnificus]
MHLTDTLILTPANKIEHWRDIIRSVLQSGKNVIWVGDTETTGTEPKGDRANKDIRDRVLEIALLAYVGNGTIIEKPLLDDEGLQIFFHEYVNPFKEDTKILERYNSIRYIPNEVLYVHGINESFLNGKTGLLDSKLNETDFKLPKPAKTFSEIKPALEYLSCVDLCNEVKGRLCLLAHNAPFDIEFLDCEYNKTEYLHEGNTAFAGFESFFTPIDSLQLIKEMYTRDEIRAAVKPHVMKKLQDLESAGTKITIAHNLEFLRYFYEVDDIERDVHGAMIDSVILGEVYKKMTEDNKYKELPVVKNLIRKPIQTKPICEEKLIVL